jgi:hypothetical protein
MATTNNESLVHARFFIHTVQNEGKTKQEGRPIFDEYEAVEIRFAANKETVHVAPAHEVYKRDFNMNTGENREITYAMAYNEQYQKFKKGEAQIQSGTPLSELPFLTASKRLELKALSIHTAEALATLDGQPLRMLGMGGRELKNQAQAYLDNAKGSVDVVAMAARIAALTEQVERLTGKGAAVEVTDGGSTIEVSVDAVPSPFADWDADDIKNWMRDNGGQIPRGNASHATLVKAADELNAALKVQKAEAA